MHRSAKFLVEGCAGWYPGTPPSLVSDTKTWVQTGFNDRMRPHLTGHAFQNFIDRTQVDWEHAYYGRNLDRLKEIKRQYDPNNLFRFEQSISPAA
jgi:hypothetical protein